MGSGHSFPSEVRRRLCVSALIVLSRLAMEYARYEILHDRSTGPPTQNDAPSRIWIDGELRAEYGDNCVFKRTSLKADKSQKKSSKIPDVWALWQVEAVIDHRCVVYGSIEGTS
ncbi:hypothetical protein Y032_0021g328 [Ancylostoma ceylanicum]|uniref:Uncharacterized protein n=1 Tax=Ancylostoma ceylanicum TaxID=53326 RepID=A0A016UZ08_9BILA|nr:hypothetical protein Y032_0021g328 [Ancylostoma ceylanicum]